MRHVLTPVLRPLHSLRMSECQNVIEMKGPGGDEELREISGT